MIQPELVDYIKKQLSNGHDAPTIREHLLKHGYTEAVADEALHTIAPPQKQKIPGLKYLPFSNKTIAFAVLALVVLGGIGFGLFSFSGNSGNLAGAAHEAPEEFMDEPQPKKQKEVPSQESVLEDEKYLEEESDDEEMTETEETYEEVEEENIEEETEESSEDEEINEEDQEIEEDTEEESSEEEIAAGVGCDSNSDCETDSVCYQKVCSTDTDRDGAADTLEEDKGTDIHDQDSDDDSYFDADEFSAKTDALDSADPGYTSCKVTTDCASGQGCSTSGICVTCDDSDDQEYKKAGTIRGVQYTTGNIVLSKESCNSSGMLTEYYCRSDGYSYSETVDCATAVGTEYSCSNGKCVKG